MYVNVCSHGCVSRLSTMDPCICCCHKEWGLSWGTNDTLATCLLPEHPCLVSAKGWGVLSYLASLVHLLIHARWENTPLEKKISVSGFNFGNWGVGQSWSCPCERLDWPHTKLWFYLHSSMLEIVGAGKSTSEQHFLVKPFKCRSWVSSVLCHTAWVWCRVRLARWIKG